jgi:hypothetical protein
MRIRRAILVFLVALSVATLPANGGSVLAASMTPSGVESVASGPMVADALPEAAHDCCPGDHDRNAMSCASMAACALSCFGFADTSFSKLPFPAMSANMMPVLASQTLGSQMGCPPFRPPRS